MKLRIKSMIWNIRKKKNQSEQPEEKRIQKKMKKVYAAFGTTSRSTTFAL